MAKPPATVRIELRVLGETVAVTAAQPPARGRLDELLPLFRAIDDAVVELAVRRAEAAGNTVSCRKGCSACCEAQPVPVTPPEAYALRLLVDRLPEPRRGITRERFTDHVAKLDAAGLKSAFLTRDPALDAAQARDLAARYFKLGIVCPFLEDGACGIYEERPFVCRQYLVTSPAELCADPFVNPVQPIRLPIAPATAMLKVSEETLGTPQHTVPLVLALELAEARRDELERPADSATVARKWVTELGAKS